MFGEQKEKKDSIMDDVSVREKLVNLVREEAERSGYVLVDVALRGGRGINLVVAVDKEGGITLDGCSAFNKKIVSLLESEGMLESVNTLDVNSPGLDRVLKSESEFVWAAGKDVEVRVYEPLEGETIIFGKLLEATENGVTIEDENGSTVCVSKNNIAKIKLTVTI